MSIPEFNNEEIAQYSRHLILPEFNIEGQRKLKNSSVLVVGAGGLGCPLLQYLTAAGVGHLGIVDYDIVDQSNLQRQVLYSVDDIGKSKAETAAKKLFRLNPHISFSVINDQLTSRNALEIISKFDIVCDGTDNFPTRYLVNDACVILDKPNIHGAIFKFEGQVSVFNYKFENGDHGPQYRDIFPTPPPPGEVPSCAEGGVLGVLPGILGSIQASETIKVIAGIGEPLAGKLFIFDALSFETRILKINKNPDLQIPEVLIDYDDFCGLNESPDRTVTEISVEELKSMIDKDKDFQLIDVRNQYEHNIASLEGLLIPLDDLDQRVSEIRTDKTTIFYCRSGIRSAKAIKKLQKLGFKNLFNLKGGIMEWAEKINPSLPRY